MTFRQVILKIQFTMAMLTALLSVVFFFAGGLDGIKILYIPAAIAAATLLILAFRFPSNPLAVTFAGVGSAGSLLCLMTLPSVMPWAEGEFALSGTTGYFLGVLQVLITLTGFVTCAIFLCICSDEIKKRQDRRRQTIQKAALVENDVEQLQRALGDYLRPDFNYLVWLFGIIVISGLFDAYTPSIAT